MKARTAGLLVLLLGLGLGLGAAACKRLASVLARPEPIVDADYRFRWAAPGPDWKLMTEKEARRLVPDAAAGAMQEGGGVKNLYAIVIVEPYLGELGAYADLVVGNAPLEDKLKEMAAIGSVVEWKHKRWNVTVIALFTMDTQLDEDSLLSRFKPKHPALALLSSSTTPGVLAGVPGKRLRSGVVGSNRSDLVVIRRDRTLFALFVDAKSGTLAEADLAALHAGFRLLD